MNTFQSKQISSLILATIACGCASTNSNPPIVQNVFEVDAEYNRVSSLGASSNIEVSSRSGAATFSGKTIGDFSESSDITGGMIGDIVVNVNFTSGTMSGALDNINIVNDGEATQSLTGNMDVSGNISGPRVSATASGTISGPTIGTASGVFYLSGDFYNDTSSADTVGGTFSGSANGDFLIDVEGGFFLSE